MRSSLPLLLLLPSLLGLTPPRCWPAMDASRGSKELGGAAASSGLGSTTELPTVLADFAAASTSELALFPTSSSVRFTTALLSWLPTDNWSCFLLFRLFPVISKRDVGLSLGDEAVTGEDAAFTAGGEDMLLAGGGGRSGNAGSIGVGQRHFREV